MFVQPFINPYFLYEADDGGGSGGDNNGGDPEGQGEDQDGGLYDLSSVPEELRPHIEPHLKAIEGNVTRKFQDYSEKLDGWEAYEKLGVQDVDPEQLGQLLQFAQLAQDEDAFAEWWREVGDRMGLMPESEDDFDFDDDDLDDLSPEKIQELVAEAVTENLAPIQESLSRSEQERVEQEQYDLIDERLGALKEEHGDDLDTDAILQLSLAYVQEDPDNAIDRGFEDYQRIVGKGESGLFESKAGQPAPVEGSGSADNSVKPVTTFEDAKAAALERMKQSKQAVS